jgi:hypothetical protein
MFKNVAGQKWVVFAFNETDNTAKTGDAANITGNLRIDGGAANAIDDLNPTELEDGYYVFDISQAESNGDSILICPASSTANIQVIGCPAVMITEPPNFNTLGIESDGDLTKVNTLDGHTPQTADNNVILAHANYGNAQLARTGADGDTLETLSDEVAAIQTDTTTLKANTTFMTKVVKNRREVSKVGDSWYLYVYDDDGTTPIITKKLVDKDATDIDDLISGVLAAEDASSV